MKSILSFKRIFPILLVLLAIMFSDCASQKKHKRLKPGKPIPCPQKDC
ncbi:MAG: hypothetical protein KF725_15740 [Cyclobacteriaceae bacterium]|nr:hypothetical protein [Cyclobacteriaceae bacterium]UYN87790.1 MAG: hypothetical protein KIT51_05920 [Cyclobacteriaceae bacterium]